MRITVPPTMRTQFPCRKAGCMRAACLDRRTSGHTSTQARKLYFGGTRMALARALGLALALALGVFGLAIAQRGEPLATEPRGDTTPSASELIGELHQINQHEIQAGTLAKRNSQSVRVQRFGD